MSKIIPPETLEQIAAANDIVEVIGSYFPLRRAGITYKALCPFHREKTPSFTVNPQRQFFKCFGCGASGTIFRFVMDYEHIEFVAAVRKLADRAGIPLVQEELSPEDAGKISMRRRLLALHAEAADWFHQQLMKKPAAQVAREYLKSRGISVDVAKSWRIGYAPESWDSLGGRLVAQGFTREEIVKSGLVIEREGGEGFYDRFRHRVMIPICNDMAEVIAFSGRVLESDPKAAKYINSPETILFTKGDVLFGIHKSKRALIEKKSAVVCEGPLDLITAFEAGVQNVLASQGTAFTERQANILQRYVSEVVLCFDADAAGEKAAERSLPSLLAQNLGVRVAMMPPGEDPDSLIRGQGAEVFLEQIRGARDFFEFQLDRMSARPEFSTPKGRTQAARTLASWISLVKDPVMREALTSRVSMRLEISGAEFTKLLRTPKRGTPMADSSQEEQRTITPTPLDPTLRLIASVAVHDPDARAWLLEEEWRERLEPEPNSELIVKILEADFQPEEPASLQVFLTTLSPEDESAVIELLGEKSPANPLAVARDCWNELERRQIRRRIEAIHARLRSPGLSADEATILQKEILDRQKRLLDIAPPLSPSL